MANPYPKVIRDSKHTSPQDASRFNKERDLIDLFTKYWAIINSKDDTYLDKFNINVFADEFRGRTLANNVDAYSLDLHQYHAGDFVQVYWRPEADKALIVGRGLFAFIKVTKDWAPNETYIQGFKCDRLGTSITDGHPDVYVALDGSGYPAAYAPYKKNDIVMYLDWAFTSPDSWETNQPPISFPITYEGFVWGAQKLPIPTSLHQVLTVVGLVGDKYRIGWDYLRSHDRTAEPEAS